MAGVFQYLECRSRGLTKGDKFRKCQNVVLNLLEDVSTKPAQNQPCEFSAEARATFLMDFSPNMLRVASTHGDHTVRVTDIRTGRCTHILTGHPRTPWCLAFNPTSNDILASGCLSGQIRIWDLLGGGSEVLANPCVGQVITSLAFHPCGNVLVFATLNCIYFWDWSQQSPFAVTKTTHDYERIRWLKFDPQGHYLYTGIANHTPAPREASAGISSLFSEGIPDLEDVPGPSGERGAQQQLNRVRYQRLLQRFMQFQQDRSTHGNRGSSQSSVDSSNNPPSPVHEEGLSRARQYANYVTALSGARRSFEAWSSGRFDPMPAERHQMGRASDSSRSGAQRSFPSAMHLPDSESSSLDDGGMRERNLGTGSSASSRQDESQSRRRWGRYEPSFFARRYGSSDSRYGEAGDGANNSHSSIFGHSSGHHSSHRLDIPHPARMDRPHTGPQQTLGDLHSRPRTNLFSSHGAESAGSSAASSSLTLMSGRGGMPRSGNAASESLDANEFEILPVDQERDSRPSSVRSSNASASESASHSSSYLRQRDELHTLLNRFLHRYGEGSSASSGAALSSPVPSLASMSSAASTAEGGEALARTSLLFNEPASARHLDSQQTSDRGLRTSDSNPVLNSDVFLGVSNHETFDVPSSQSFSTAATSVSAPRTASQRLLLRGDIERETDPFSGVSRSSLGSSSTAASTSARGSIFGSFSNEPSLVRRRMSSAYGSRPSFDLSEGLEFRRHLSSLQDRLAPRPVTDQTSQTLGAMNLPESLDQGTDVAGLDDHQVHDEPLVCTGVSGEDHRHNQCCNFEELSSAPSGFGSAMQEDSCLELSNAGSDRPVRGSSAEHSSSRNERISSVTDGLTVSQNDSSLDDRLRLSLLQQAEDALLSERIRIETCSESETVNSANRHGDREGRGGQHRDLLPAAQDVNSVVSDITRADTGSGQSSGTGSSLSHDSAMDTIARDLSNIDEREYIRRRRLDKRLPLRKRDLSLASGLPFNVDQYSNEEKRRRLLVSSDQSVVGQEAAGQSSGEPPEQFRTSAAPNSSSAALGTEQADVFVPSLSSTFSRVRPLPLHGAFQRESLSSDGSHRCSDCPSCCTSRLSYLCSHCNNRYPVSAASSPSASSSSRTVTLPHIASTQTSDSNIPTHSSTISRDQHSDITESSHQQPLSDTGELLSRHPQSVDSGYVHGGSVSQSSAQEIQGFDSSILRSSLTRPHPTSLSATETVPSSSSVSRLLRSALMSLPSADLLRNTLMSQPSTDTSNRLRPFGDGNEPSAFSVFRTSNREAASSASDFRTSSSLLNPASANPTSSTTYHPPRSGPQPQSQTSTSTSQAATGLASESGSESQSASYEGRLNAVRDVQERLQLAVQQLRDVQSSVRELTLSAPQTSTMRPDSITEYLEMRVAELDRRISDLEESYNSRLRELQHDCLMRRIQANRERRRLLTSSPYIRRHPTRLRDSLRSVARGRMHDAGDAPPILSRARVSLLERRGISESRVTPMTTASSSTSSSTASSTATSRTPPTHHRQLLECLMRPGSSQPVSTNTRTEMPTSITIRPAREDEEGEASLWNLRYGYLHPDYSSSILDDTINRPSEAMQHIMSRTIAGAFMSRDDQAVANNIVPQTHRIQQWDISNIPVPDIGNPHINIVVPHCKLHNDASCDLSQDGTILAAFVPSHRGFPDDNILAIFSVRKANFGQCLYTKSFGPNAISVSISPIKRHVLVGLAAKRLFFFSVNQMVAQVYKMVREGQGERSMEHVRDLYHPCSQDIRNNVSVNSARWLPGVGEGMVYGTNRGDLHFCRPGSRKVLERESPNLSSSARSLDGPLLARRRNAVRSSIATQTTTVSIRRSASTQTFGTGGVEDGGDISSQAS